MAHQAMYAALTPTAADVLFTGDLNGDFLARRTPATGHGGGAIPLSGSASIVIFGP
jgi:hypothetical protein